jgi:hypothetical protein
MARIRSVHPSLFTDEAWVSCLPLARLLYIGLWTDADDQGLFEWKPLQLKMRLLPGDDADVATLLAELVSVNLIAGLEAGGKKLGAIRYFRRFQRPKKPNSTFVLPAEWVNYVGLGDGKEETGQLQASKIPNQFPTDGENPPQMEDGGWRREEGVTDPNGSASLGAASDEDEDLDPLAEIRAMPAAKGCWRLAIKVLMDQGRLPDPKARAFVGKLKAQGLTDDELWSISEAAFNEGTEAPQPYLLKAAEGVIARRGQSPLMVEEWQQRRWMTEFAEHPTWWRPDRGPSPGEAGCRVSADIQREFGIEPAKPQAVRVTA